MDNPGAGCESQCAVICIDGITNSVISGFTPDISWRDYVAWLRRRRPGLHVIHLKQPHDWGELIMGRPDQHERLLAEMAELAFSEYDESIKRIVILGFSLGGLRALQVLNRIVAQQRDIDIDYLALVTFGTPFKATGRPTDLLLKHMAFDYFKHMLDIERHRESLSQLIDDSGDARIRILLGEIEHDEVVSASSSLSPAHWLSGRRLPDNVKWGTFLIRNSNRLRPHDGLLHDPLAIGYIDGLVDGLLPFLPADYLYREFTIPGSRN